MEDKDKIVAKIQNLLDLAGNNSNQNEAIAASLKAQQLMAKYDVELADIDNSHDKLEIAEEYCECNKDGLSFKRMLASAIARNFRCKCYTRQSFDLIQVFFYGYRQDAEIASRVFSYLYHTGIRMANKQYREKRAYGYSFSRTDWLLGFADGVDRELGKQCRALMLITPQEVEDGYQEIIKGAKQPRKVYVRHEDEYNHGVYTGRETARGQYLETSFDISKI